MSVSLSIGFREEFPASLGRDPSQLTTWRKLGEVVPCLHVNATPGRVPPFVGVFVCGLFQLGELSVKKQALDEIATNNQLSLSGGVRGGLDVTLPWVPGFTFFLPIDLAFMAKREPVDAGDLPQIIWRPEHILRGVGFGVVYTLPWP